MEIRKAKASDNLKEIAELIYETDKYIYPNLATTKDKAISIIIDMIKSRTIFNYKNCLIAIDNSCIVGLICYTRKTSPPNCYDKWLYSDDKLKHVIENYILKCEAESKESEIALTCVCVKAEHRRQKIAAKLIQHMFQLFPNKYIYLYTLKHNSAAINLYQSMGFKIINEQKGYNCYYKHKPLVYLMGKQN